MDILLIGIVILFFGLCLAYVGFLDREGKSWKA
jgi:hypothetical protein